VVPKVKVGRAPLVAAGMVGVLAAGAVASSNADAAAAPLAVAFATCGTGGSTGWNSSLEPVLTPGTDPAGACRIAPFIPAADPAYAIMFIPSSARLAAPATEPTLTVSAPSGGPSSRLVINLENGQTLVGYPGLALTGESGPDAAGMAWAVGNSTTYTDYQTAYSAAGASSTTASEAWVQAVAGSVPGTTATVTGVQYGGRTLGAGTVTVNVIGGPQVVQVGVAVSPLLITASTTSSDTTGISFSATGLPDGLTLNSNHTITGTPAADAKSGIATVTARDAYGQVGTATISFTVNPAPPVLSHGKGVATAPTRETVTWQQTLPSWEKFTIVGPGAINGHVGWVPPGTEVGYYAGLEAHHGYTVTYTPYTAKNGSPIPGANPGKVYFVS
jgi:hypothetical protein